MEWIQYYPRTASHWSQQIQNISPAIKLYFPIKVSQVLVIKQGAAMLTSVFENEKAIQINI